MGQLVVAVAGAAIGAVVGGPAGARAGWAIGSIVGSSLFGASQKGKDLQPTDARITGTEYGQAFVYFEGRFRGAAQLVWASKRRAIKNKQSYGKGGGATSTSITYQADLLFKLTENQSGGVPRCWVNGKIVRNLLDTATADERQASVESEYWSDFIVYTGDEAQLPDPTYEAAIGIGKAPAFRGCTTVMIRDAELGSGGQVQNYTFEVVTDLSEAVDDSEKLAWTLPTTYTSTPSFNPAGISIETYAYPSLIATTYQISSIGKVKQISTRSFSDYYSAGLNQVIGVADIDCVVWDLPDHDGFLLERIGGGLSTSFISPAVGIGPPGANTLAIRGNDMVIALGVAGGHLARFDLTGGAALASATGYGGGSHGLQIAGDKLYWIASSAGPVKEFDLASMAFIRNLPAFASSIDYIFSSDAGDLYAVAGDYISQFDGAAWVPLAGGSTHISIAGAAGAPGATMVGGTLYNHSIGAGSTLEMWAINLAPVMTPGSVLLPDVVERLCLRAYLRADQFDVSALPNDAVDCFYLAQATTVRQALEILAAAHFFTCRLTDKLYFVPVFTSSVVTIPFDDLGAAPDDQDHPEPLELITLNDLEKPAQFALSYLNTDADYNNATAYTDRHLTSQGSLSEANLTMGFNSTRAQAIVETTRDDNAAHLFNTTVALLPYYTRLQPADVIVATGSDGIQHTLRVNRRTDSQGIITLDCRRHDGTVTQTAGFDGGEYLSTGVVRNLPFTDAEYMDIPLLQDADDASPVVYVAAKGTSAGWLGAAIFKGVDESDYAQVALATSAAVFGVCSTTLADFSGGNVFDHTSTLTVDVGQGELSSVTRGQMLDSGANAALVGSEVIQFRYATVVSAGVYTLSGLLRGRLGTEWAQVDHAGGERFVLLTPTELRRIPLLTSELSALRYYSAVTLGKNISSGSDDFLTCTGVSKKPWAPVRPRVTRPSAKGPSILLHMDGTNGSTTFTDSSINALNFTAAGNAQISTAQAVFGGASYLGDGTGDYISRAHNTVFDVATGDFTVACRVRPNSVGAQQIIAIKQLASGNGTFILYLSATGFLKFGASNTSGVLIVDLTAAAAVTPGTWYHLVGVREGNVFRLYIDGVQQASATNSSSLQSNATHPLVVGGFSNGTQSFNGHIDEFAFWKGLAVYPGGTTFTPESVAYTDPGAGTGNVIVEFDRRTRLRANFTNGYVPLGEETESYEVVVYTNSSYVTPVRTVTGLTSPSWEYTRDQQIADFGSQQSTVYADIFQMSAIVGRGYPLRGAF